MTEAEWLTCAMAEQMVAALPLTTGARKFRLLSAACCLRIVPLLADARSRHARDTLERFADDVATEEERSVAAEYAGSAFIDRCDAVGEGWDADPLALASSAVWTSTASEWEALTGGSTLRDITEGVLAQAAASTSDYMSESEAQSELVRDVFGNPFRPAAFNPAWRTDTAVTLARTMYEAREFGAMPILADALQDAGCDCGDVLAHCRGANRPHVRGCWVVDLVLGKE